MKRSVLSGKFSEKELEETPWSTATAYGANNGYWAPRRYHQVEHGSSHVPPWVWRGIIGLWLADKSKRHGGRVVMDERLNPYVRWIRECSGVSGMSQKEVEVDLGALPACSRVCFS